MNVNKQDAEKIRIAADLIAYKYHGDEIAKFIKDDLMRIANKLEGLNDRKTKLEQ
jgi:hypothetical protein